MAAEPSAQPRDLFVRPADGSTAAVQVNASEPGSGLVGDVVEQVVFPDGRGLIYRADEDLDERFALFFVGLESPTRSRRLSPGLLGVVEGPTVSPAGDVVVFQTQDARLWRIDVTQTGGPIPIDQGVASFPLPLVIAPDGTRVFYLRRLATGNELRSAALDGTTPPFTVHPALGTARTVQDFVLAPDGQTLVYRADAVQDGQYELFAVPSDGGLPLRLGPLPAFGDVLPGYAIAPTGTHVVFLADRNVDGRFELFSARLDGSAGAQRPNAPLPTNGDVTGFAFLPDGSGVVYRANRFSSVQFDLFVTPLEHRYRHIRSADGHGPTDVRRLTDQPDGRRVEPDFVVDADGQQVFYRANSATSAQPNLHRVSTTGGAPESLIPGLPGSRRVLSFALTPDQTRVVYLANARALGVFELFSVPPGGGPAIALDQRPSFSGVDAFAIAPESNRVVFRADRERNEVFDLWSVPLDASTAPRRINAFLPANGDVETAFTPLTGGRTIYRADTRRNDAFDLFLDGSDLFLPAEAPTRIVER